jgi:hypothetical protein
VRADPYVESAAPTHRRRRGAPARRQRVAAPHALFAPEALLGFARRQAGHRKLPHDPLRRHGLGVVSGASPRGDHAHRHQRDGGENATDANAAAKLRHALR